MSVHTCSSIPGYVSYVTHHHMPCCVQVDVEGWEWSVMQGANQLLASHNVENLVMEYSPGVCEGKYNTLHIFHSPFLKHWTFALPI